MPERSWNPQLLEDLGSIRVALEDVRQQAADVQDAMVTRVELDRSRRVWRFFALLGLAMVAAAFVVLGVIAADTHDATNELRAANAQTDRNGQALLDDQYTRTVQAIASCTARNQQAVSLVTLLKSLRVHEPVVQRGPIDAYLRTVKIPSCQPYVDAAGRLKAKGAQLVE